MKALTLLLLLFRLAAQQLLDQAGNPITKDPPLIHQRVTNTNCPIFPKRNMETFVACKERYTPGSEPYKRNCRSTVNSLQLKLKEYKELLQAANNNSQGPVCPDVSPQLEPMQRTVSANPLCPILPDYEYDSWIYCRKQYPPGSGLYQSQCYSLYLAMQTAWNAYLTTMEEMNSETILCKELRSWREFTKPFF